MHPRRADHQPEGDRADRRRDRDRASASSGPATATKEFRGEPVAPIEPERGGRGVDRRARDPGRPGRSGDAPPETGERFPRSRFLEGATLGLGGVIGGLVTVPAIGFMIVPAFRGPGLSEGRPRPAGELHGRQVVRDEVLHEPGGRRGVAPHRVHPQQRPAGRQAELHDHLEPLRAPRLPGAAERPRAGQPDEGGRRQEGPADHDDPGDSRRRLRLPVPRRPVRHRGQPRLRPARSRARPLRVRGRRRPPHPRQARTACRT